MAIETLRAVAGVPHALPPRQLSVRAGCEQRGGPWAAAAQLGTMSSPHESTVGKYSAIWTSHALVPLSHVLTLMPMGTVSPTRYTSWFSSWLARPAHAFVKPQ